MGTSIKQPIWKVLVLVSNMTKEGLKFGKLNFPKAFLGWCYCPVKVSHTCFFPPSNDFTVFLLAEFGQNFLDFYRKIQTIAMRLFKVQLTCLNQADSIQQGKPLPLVIRVIYWLNCLWIPVIILFEWYNFCYCLRTFPNVPEIKEVINNCLSWFSAFFATLLSRPFSNRDMSVRDKRLDNHASGQQIGECFLEGHELNPWTAMCLVSLESNMCLCLCLVFSIQQVSVYMCSW